MLGASHEPCLLLLVMMAFCSVCILAANRRTLDLTNSNDGSITLCLFLPDCHYGHYVLIACCVSRVLNQECPYD